MPAIFKREVNREAMFDLGPGDVPGNLPPEGDDESSVTLRVVRTEAGANILIRFSQGLDRYTVHTLESSSPDALFEEICDVARSMFTGLLKSPKRWKEVEPGLLVGIWAGRNREDDPEFLQQCVCTAYDQLKLAGLRPTADTIAEKLDIKSGDALRARLRPHVRFSDLIAKHKKRR